MRTNRAPEWLRQQVLSIEGNDQLDQAVDRMSGLAGKVARGPAGDALSGQWLGHALHPLLTDLPLGCWMSSGLLDLLGGKSGRKASQRLIGLGLAFVPPTTASGLVDWSKTDDERVKRVGTVHALGNTAVAALYLLSWRSRRKGRHLTGVLLGLVGLTLGWATGYLGGHMSFARGSGVGERGLDSPTRHGEAAGGLGDLLDVRAAAEMLTVQPEQVQAMVVGGLLVPTAGEGESARFTRANVLAARSIGG